VTNAELLILKANILASPDLDALKGSPNGRFEIARLYNLPASPTWVIWRRSVSRREILQNGFDWTRLDNLSVGKARVWTDIFVDGVINPAKANVRAGIEAVWVGTQADLAVREAIYVHCRTNATRVQKLFSTGTGTTISPAMPSDSGSSDLTVSLFDVESALNLA